MKRSYRLTPAKLLIGLVVISGLTCFELNAHSGTQASEDPFYIQLNFLTEPSEEVRIEFESAVKKWENVIVSSVSNQFVYRAGLRCGGSADTVFDHDLVVDKLMIFVAIEPIDGRGGILASATPCYLSVRGGTFPRVGIMKFDTADINAILSENRLSSVIQHEMGHVLGIGSLWKYTNLTGRPNAAGIVSYRGRGGKQGLRIINRGFARDHRRPRIETKGGGGTGGVHWDSKSYPGELMIGWVSNLMSLSAMSANSLRDYGYGIKTKGADPYFIRGNPAPTPSTSGEELIPLGDDIIDTDIITYDEGVVPYVDGKPLLEPFVQ